MRKVVSLGERNAKQAAMGQGVTRQRWFQNDRERPMGGKRFGRCQEHKRRNTVWEVSDV